MAELNKIILQSKINKNVKLKGDAIVEIIKKDFKNISIKEFCKFFETFLKGSKQLEIETRRSMQVIVTDSDKSGYKKMNPDLFYTLYLFIQAYAYVPKLSDAELVNIDKVFASVKEYCANKDIVDRLSVYLVSNWSFTDGPKALDIVNMKNMLMYISARAQALTKYIDPLEAYIYEKTNINIWREVSKIDPELLLNIKPNAEIAKAALEYYEKNKGDFIYDYLNRWKNNLIYSDGVVDRVKSIMTKNNLKFNKLDIEWQKEIMPLSQQAIEHWADVWLNSDYKHIAAIAIIKNIEKGFKIPAEKGIKIIDIIYRTKEFVLMDMLLHLFLNFWNIPEIKELLKCIYITNGYDMLSVIRELKKKGAEEPLLEELSKLYLEKKIGASDAPLHEVLIHFAEEIEDMCEE